MLYQRRALHVRKRTRGWDALASSVVSSLFQRSKRQVFPTTFSAACPADRFPWLPSLLALWRTKVVLSTHVSHITYLSTLSRYPRQNKIHCTVDDGTGTIECAFRPGEGKPESKPIEARHVLPLPQKPTDGPASTISQPPPLIPVGSVVTVQGKVRAKRDSRDLHGETIGLCSTVTLSEISC